MKYRPVIVKFLLSFTLLIQVLVSFGVTGFAASKGAVLVPILNSIDKKDGSNSSDPKSAVYSAVFGYTNLTNKNVVVPAGSDNFLSPVDLQSKANVVEKFKSGTEVNTFRVEVKCDEQVTWTIKGPNPTAQSITAKAPACIQPSDSTTSTDSLNSPSCVNPVGWIEDTSRKDANNKFYWVPKNTSSPLPQNATRESNPELFNTILCSYTDKVNFKDADGKFKSIDNTIKEIDAGDTKRKNEGYRYVNSGNDFKAYFSQNPNSGWKFESDDGTKVNVLKVSIAGRDLASNSISTNGGSITYSDVLPNVDLQYSVDNSGVSKAFILKNKKALENDLSKIEFTLDTGNKKLVKSNALSEAIDKDVEEDLATKNKKSLSKKVEISESISDSDIQDQIDSLVKSKAKAEKTINSKNKKVKDLVKATLNNDTKTLQDPKSGIKTLTESQQKEFNTTLLENQKQLLADSKKQALEGLKEKFKTGKIDSKNKPKLKEEIDRVNNLADYADTLKVEGGNQKSDLKIEAPFSYESVNSSTPTTGGIKADSFKISSDGKTYTIYPDQSYLNDSKRQFPVIIDPRLIGGNYTAADTFYNQRDPNSPRGSNNSFHIAVGGYPCINNGTSSCYPLWSTRTAITFNIPGEIKTAGNVVWANFRLKQYSTYGGGFRMNIFNACDFNEWNVTWNSQPCIAEWRGDIRAGNTNCWWAGCGTDNWSSDIGQFVRDAVNYGGRRIHMVIADENENLYRGATFCSKDGWLGGHPCNNGVVQGPYLQVMLNEQPTPPNLESPDSNDEINGHCDLSVTPTTGNCNRLNNLSFRVSNINDGDGDCNAAYTRIQIRENISAPQFGYNDFTGKYGPGCNPITVNNNIGNGRFTFAAVNSDQYNLDSFPSTPKENVVVDTQPPALLSKPNLPQFSKGNQVEFNAGDYVDNTLNRIRISYSNLVNTPVQINLKNSNVALAATGNIAFGNNEQTSLASKNSTQNSQIWRTTTNQEIRALNGGGRCLTAATQTLAAAVNIFDCNNTNNQRWLFLDNGAIQNKGTNLCLKSQNAATQFGTKMVLSNCDTSDQLQQFELKNLDTANQAKNLTSNVVATGGTFRSGTPFYMINPRNLTEQSWTYSTISKEIKTAFGYCLDAGSSNPIAGTVPLLWGCTEASNQQWRFTPAGEIRSNYAGNQNLCLELVNYNTAEGATVVMNNCDYSLKQKWTGDVVNTFRLKQLASNLSVDSGAINPGAGVFLNSSNNAQSQTWVYTSSNEFRPINSEMCLDGSTAPVGQVVYVYNCAGQIYQKWDILAVVPGTTSPIMIRSRTNPALCVDQSGATTSSQAFKLLACDSNNNNQKFEVENSFKYANPTNEFAYYTQVARDSNFTDLVNSNQAWTANPNQVVGGLGVDAGLADKTYYVRYKASDRSVGNGNISTWTNFTTIVDVLEPQVRLATSTPNRFAPGTVQNIVITGQVSEKNLGNIVVQIKDENGGVVRTLNQCQLSSVGVVPAASPAPVLCNSDYLNFSYDATKTPTDPANFFQVNFTWDGKDTNGVALTSSGYVASIVATDKAGNTNDNLAGSNALIGLDGQAPKVSLSQPTNNFWTNKNNFVLQGQVGVKGSGLPFETDVASLEIQKLDIDGAATVSNGFAYQPLSYNATNNFSFTPTLDQGENRFAFRTKDNLGNTNTKIGLSGNEVDYWSLNYENNPADITSVLPSGNLTAGSSNPNPTLVFKVKDNVSSGKPMASGFKMAYSTTVPAINPAGFDVNLLQSFTGDNGTWNVIPLYKDGVNITNSQNNPRLAGDLSCLANGTTATSEVTCSLPLKGLPDAQYLIDIRVRDKAGNQTCSYNHVEISASDRCDTNNGDKIQTSDTKFIVKSRAYLEVSTPSDNSLIASTTTTIIGKAEKGQTLVISNFNAADANSSLDRKLQILLDPSKNNVLPAEFVSTTNVLMVPEGVNSGANATPVTANVRKLSNVGNPIQITCNENIDDDNNTQTPNLDICSFSITVNQATNLVATTQGPGINVRSNLNKITLNDNFGNSKVKDIKVLVDLYGINLESKPDLKTFSPNGDTRYDQISFETKATKIVDGSDYTETPKSYEFVIKNAAGAIVWQNKWVRPTGGNVAPQGTVTFNLPTPVIFDGKVNQAIGANQTQAPGSWLMDGNYSYSFILVTMDNVTFSTPVQALVAKSTLVSQTAIFSPLDNYVTSRGVINVQGQAPVSTPTNQVKTTICVDAVTTPDTNNCDVSFVANSSSSGFFSSIVSLPTSVLVNGVPTNTTTFKIRAKSTDGAGNTTPDSSIINVKLNTATNIVSATTISDLGGVNSPTEIADFLAGRSNISTLKSVKIQTQVSQDVEALDIDYADYSNLNELPGTNPVTGQPTVNSGGINTSPTNKIASINNLTETDLNWNPLQDITIKKDQKASLGANQTGADLATNGDNKCVVTAPATSCNWNYNYPYPTNLTGGIYEIRLRAYKGGNFEDITRSFAVNAVVPAAPALLQVQKQYTKVPCTANPAATPPVVCTDFKVANQVNSNYYTNNRIIKLFGASDLNTTLKLTIKNSGGTVVSSIDVPVTATGLWTQDVILPAVDGTYSVSLASSLGSGVSQVTTNSTQSSQIVLDTTLPQIQWVQTKTTSAYNGLSINPWTNSSPVQFDIRTNEPILSGNILAQDAKVIKPTFKDIPVSCVASNGDTANSNGATTLWNIQNNTNVSKQCLTDYYASTRLQGEFTIQNITQEGLYLPIIQLEDLAGNRVYTSNGQYQIDNLKNNLLAVNPNNETQDDPKVVTAIYGVPAVANGDPARGTDPYPAGYPHLPTAPRGKSLDFRLFYDITPTYKTDLNNPTSLALNPWADKQEGLAANGLAPEADRLLTDPLYYTTGPTLNPPTPQQTKPVFVTRGNTVTLTGTIEKNQRALITAIKRKTDTPNYQEVISNILPVMNYTNCVSSNPTAVPAITDTVKQYLTVKYKDICTFTANFTMNDDGRSPDGVPNNSYSFSFIPVDRAGNTPIPANPVQDAPFQIDQALVLPIQGNEAGNGDPVIASTDITSYDFKFKILNKLNDLSNVTTKFEVQQVQLDTNGDPILTSSDPTKQPTTVHTYTQNDQTLTKNQQSSYAFTWNVGILDTNNQYIVKVTFSNQSGVLFTNPQALSFKPYTGNILANVGSQTITVFHDTDNPKDHKITNIGSNSYTASNPAFTSTIPGFDIAGNNPCISSTNSAGNPDPNCTTSYPITKDTTIIPTIQGERKADIEVKKYFTKNTVTGANTTTTFNPFTLQGTSPYKNGDSGIYTRYIGIGPTPTDETNTTGTNPANPCYTISNTPIKNRRVGTCGDGLYKLRMRMVDSSGNNTATQGTANTPGFTPTSQSGTTPAAGTISVDALDSWKDYLVERDTTKPANPTLTASSTPVEYGLYEQAGLSITGEAKTSATVTITSSSGYFNTRYLYLGDTANYTTSNLIGKLACGGITYTFTVNTTDRAGNISGSTTTTLTTKPCPRCDSQVSASGWVNPIQNPQSVVTSNWRSSLRPDHRGIDIGVSGDPNGTIPVLAAKDGVVKLISIDQWGGYYIDIDHGGGLVTRYVHLYSPASNFVQVNQSITAGTQIGLMGSTGNSTGPHLHFEVISNGVDIQPRDYVFKEGSSNNSSTTLVTDATQRAYFCNTQASEGDDAGSGGEGDDEEFYGSVFEVNSIPTSWITPEYYTAKLVQIIKDDYNKYLSPGYNCFFGELAIQKKLGCDKLKNQTYVTEMLNYMLQFLISFTDGYVAVAKNYLSDWIRQIQDFINDPWKVISDTFKALIQNFIDFLNFVSNPQNVLHLLNSITDEFEALTPFERIDLIATALGQLVATFQLNFFTGMAISLAVGVMFNAFKQIAAVGVKSVKLGIKMLDSVEIKKFNNPYKIKVVKPQGSGAGFDSVDLFNYIVILEKSEVDEFAGVFSPSVGAKVQKAKNLLDFPDPSLLRKSTGRNTPNSMLEKLMLKESMMNPRSGNLLYNKDGTKMAIGDSTWPEAGWFKYERKFRYKDMSGTEFTQVVHYILNEITGQVDDFKFKN